MRKQAPFGVGPPMEMQRGAVHGTTYNDDVHMLSGLHNGLCVNI